MFVCVSVYATECSCRLLCQELADHVRIRANDFAVPTGEALRCGWIDIVMLRYAHMINGFSASVGIPIILIDE